MSVRNYFCTHISRLLDFDTNDAVLFDTKYFFPKHKDWDVFNASLNNVFIHFQNPLSGLSWTCMTYCFNF